MIQNPDELTVSTFINDTTPEQHIPKAVDALVGATERVVPLTDLLHTFRKCLLSVMNDEALSSFFNSLANFLLKNLTEPGFARSKETKKQWKGLKTKWQNLLERDTKWKSEVDAFKRELKVFAQALEDDEDLNDLKAAHVKFGHDIERGLVEPTAKKLQTGLQSAVQEATWVYQDLFRVYVPRILAMLKDIPIPR